MAEPGQILGYSCVWEDAEVLCEALAPVSTGGRLLSVASAGDNVLALLLLDPSEIVAVDVNAAQLACMELKVVAFQELDRTSLLGFFGVFDAVSRWSTYRELRLILSPWARRYWDGRRPAIEAGVIHAGRFERYLRHFHRFVLPLIHSSKTIQRLREERDASSRELFYESSWNNWRWRLLCRLFFSRFVMSHLGRDPSFFAHEQGEIGARLLMRARRALTILPVHSNPYITYVIRGNYTHDVLPLYLRTTSYLLIKERLNRIRLHHGRAEQTSSLGPFDGFNLSDIFEYMSAQEYEAAYRDLLHSSNPGSRLVYWNLLADRRCPNSLINYVRPLRSLSDALQERDLGGSYERLNVEERLATGDLDPRRL
ncbi:MAG: DUF3419 family protein [Thermoanaerobaculia bacterium]